MKRTTAVGVIEEAARIWGVEPADIFWARKNVASVVAACRYVFWLERLEPPAVLGPMWARISEVRACNAERMVDRNYDSKVSELVFFAQTGMRERESANA